MSTGTREEQHMATNYTLKGRAIKEKGDSSGPHSSADEVALGHRYRGIVGRELRTLREAAKLTQEEVSNHLGIYKSAVSSIESGRVTLPPARVLELATLYDVDRNEFGKFLLRWGNPWLFALIFGDNDPQLREDLGLPPQAQASTRNKRAAQAD